MLSVGLAARDEAATIAQTLRSVEVALNNAGVRAEVIIALNGCTDATPEVVARYIAQYRGPVAYRVIESPPGQVEAQRAIAAAAGPTGGLILVDADCVVDPLCLKELTRELAEHPEAYAAWAAMVPSDHSGRSSFRRRVYNFTDYHPEVIRRGGHLCGRAFAIRRYDVPRGDPSTVDSRTAAYLSLARGPVTDDSYLSRALIHRYGPDSIHPVPAARVYFQPIPSLHDFWRAQRRKAYETLRLDLLFPAYRSLARRHFAPRVDPAGYAALRRIERLQCHLYRWTYVLLRRLARAQLRTALLLVRLGVPLRPAELWPVVRGTKRAFTAGVPAPPAPPR